MRNLFLITAILFAGASPCIAAANYSTQWQKGTTFYDQKQYDSAAWYFEQIAALKPNNAEVYYNLGNAYYRLNKIAPAVLNYQRALKINPQYAAAKDNLSLTQSRISNAIPATGDIFFINWWQSVTRPDKSTTWAVLALVSFTLVILIFLFRKLSKNKSSRMPVQAAGFISFVFLCFLVLAFATAANMEQYTAVVMQSDAPLMNGEQKGKPLILVPEGTTVKIKGKNGGWLEVALPDGRTGWLQETLVDKI